MYEWECKSSDDLVGSGLQTEVKYINDDKEEWTVPALCAEKCVNKFPERGNECNFFSAGWDEKKGICYRERTSSASCPEGFNKDSTFTFHEIKRLSK